jgi:hypothetical protein
VHLAQKVERFAVGSLQIYPQTIQQNVGVVGDLPPSYEMVDSTQPSQHLQLTYDLSSEAGRSEYEASDVFYFSPLIVTGRVTPFNDSPEPEHFNSAKQPKIGVNTAQSTNCVLGSSILIHQQALMAVY